jgi:hypothetical protein
MGKSQLAAKTICLWIYITWRTLSYGENADLLTFLTTICGFGKQLPSRKKSDGGFIICRQKTLIISGSMALGHIACAYLAYGDKHRGYFYANRSDAFLIG